MKTRIQEILNYYQLNAGEFAKIIGVSPSGLSHILNGNRNYLSTDTIVKLTQKFPEIQLDWLILGKGQMISGKPNTGLFDSLLSAGDYSVTDMEPETKSNKTTASKQIQRNVPNRKSEIKDKPAEESSGFPGMEKKIAKVVVFFTDNTFVDLYP